MMGKVFVFLADGFEETEAIAPIEVEADICFMKYQKRREQCMYFQEECQEHFI